MEPTASALEGEVPTTGPPGTSPEYVLMVDLIELDDLGYNRKRRIKDYPMYLHRQCKMKVVLFTEMAKMSEGHIFFF